VNYIIDGILLLCLGWGAYQGFRKGFIIQFFMILALLLALWCGIKFTGMIEPFMKQHFHMDDLACSIVSFFVVFLLVLILVYTSGFLVSKIIDVITLGMINRLAGAIFGILANAIIMSVLILLFNRVNDKKHFIESETLEKTYLYDPIGKVAPAFFPEKFFKKLHGVIN
jgi:membrane protein required for colicin V production